MPKHDAVKDDELRGKLDKAHQEMRKGKGTDSVHSLSEAYLYILKLKPELLEETVELRPGRKMLTVMRWPMLGANLSLESVTAKAPEIDFERDHFAVSEAITYYEYTMETALKAGL